MSVADRQRPGWAAPCLVVIAIFGILLAGIYWPVDDLRPLKMSDYWAMRAAMVLYLLLGVSGLCAIVAPTREAVRAVLPVAMTCAVMVVVTLHSIIPVMGENAGRQRAHDLLALLALVVAVAGWWTARAQIDVDEALDALEAPPAEPEPETE